MKYRVMCMLVLVNYSGFVLSQAPPAIQNIGNSCYQDSVYQLLYNLPTVRDFIVHVAPPKDMFEFRQNSIGMVVRDLFVELSKLTPKQLFTPQAICPRAIQALPGLGLKKGEAADASIFLTSLLQGMVFNDVVVKEGVRAPRCGYPFYEILDQVLTRAFMVGLRVEKQCNACGAIVVEYDKAVVSPVCDTKLCDLSRPLKEKKLSYYTCSICNQDKGGMQQLFQLTMPQVLLFNRGGGTSVQEYVKPQPFSLSLNYLFGGGDICQYDLVGILLYNGWHFQALVRPGLFMGPWYLCNGAAIDESSDKKVAMFSKSGVWEVSNYPRMLIYHRKGIVREREYSEKRLLADLAENGIDETVLDAFCNKKNCSLIDLVKGIQQRYITVEQLADEIDAQAVKLNMLKRLNWQLDSLNRNII